MNQKSIIFIGIALILLIGGIFVWKETVKAPIDDGVTPMTPTQPTVPTPPTPTQPTNPIEPIKPPQGWKTYENKEFGFAFDYPGDWELEEFRTIKKEEISYSFYQINIWSPDQFEYRKKVAYPEPRILIYASGNKPKNKEEILEKQLKNNLEAYEKYGQTVRVIDLPIGIKAYFIRNSAKGETIIILFSGVSVSFIGGPNTPLDMDIINTFRVIQR